MDPAQNLRVGSRTDPREQARVQAAGGADAAVEQGVVAGQRADQRRDAEREIRPQEGVRGGAGQVSAVGVRGGGGVGPAGQPPVLGHLSTRIGRVISIQCEGHGQ